MFLSRQTMRKTVLLTYLLHLLHLVPEVQGVPTCVPRSSCGQCIGSPGCTWCKQKGFLKPGEASERRCDTSEELTRRNCSHKQQFSPEMKVEHTKDKQLSNTPDNVVQLRPQDLHIQLRVGVPQTFKVSFKRAEGYPIDLYYLMDLSFSMGDDLDTIKTLSQDIVRTLQTFTRHMRIGFGSFVDKVALPYVSQMKRKRRDPSPFRGKICQPAFSFQNVLSLTGDAADFRREVSRQRISANLDSPESGFDAILQSTVCTDAIGWNNVTKILVYTSDDTFHMAGDGRLAGIYRPNDGRCHLDKKGFYNGTGFDYPSVGHLARTLAANNVQLIFAVTKNIAPAYEELSKLIPQSVVGVLESDSSNVVQLIRNSYNSLSSSVFLEQHGAPQGLDVSYQAHCVPEGGPAPWRRTGECKDIRLNQQVDFTVQLNISKCLEGTTGFHLSVQGISEKLMVKVEMQCECECDAEVKSSPLCSGNGMLRCGACSCDPGFQGQMCECMQSTENSCKGNSSVQCNGHGYCECGRCMCQGGFTGDFCQCDDSSCPQSHQQLCGGNGKCSCGTCNCSANHTGDACECSTLTDQCKESGDIHTPCSGKGDCICNKCSCKSGFEGDHCSTIPNICSSPYKECVVCISQNRVGGALGELCKEPCVQLELHREEELKDAPCPFEDLLYDVRLSPEGVVSLHYAHMPYIVDKTMVIIGSSVSGIIFIGLLVILISRVLMELHYRREYRSFLKAQEQTRWKETHNPLFQEPTTTIMNPLFSEDE